MRHQTVTFALALLLIGSNGCTQPFGEPTSVLDGPSAPASVVVVASAPTLLVGQSTTLAATVKDAQGQVLTSASVSWSASAPQIATISNSGTVNALSTGRVVITAASGTAKGETTIDVQAPAGAPVTPPTTPVPTPPASTAPSPAELPRTMLESGMPAPSAGSSVINVAVGGDLQAAFNAAKPGDVIKLAPGAVYSGNFTLPNKGASDAWIVIQSAETSALPAEGRRMTPALAAAGNLPRIVTPNHAAAIATAPGAHHYRFVGLEVTVAQQAEVNTLFALGTDSPGGQKTLESVPHHIVLDRMYIHGNATVVLRRGIALNSASTSIIDSYISDCHETGTDSQAILGWNGPGPFKIVNNYLEAAGENIMFGGSDPGIPDMVPSDIEIRHNHFYKPLSWRGKWLIKNLFELKNARRVLFEGNVLENSWAAAQDGTAILLKSVNQENTAPWSGTTHVTLRLNVIRNVGAAFNIAAHPEAYAVEPAHSIAVTDNVIQNINTGDFKGSAKAFLLQNALTDITIAHNTVYNDQVPYASLVFGPEGAKMTRVTYSNNITATPENWGIYGDNTGPGSVALNLYAPAAVVAGNVFAGNTGSNYPAGNFFTPLISGVGFLSAATGDFSLTAVSPFKGLATDGRDPGADIAAVRAATAGVVIP
jgi:hypothetical protein